VLPRNKVWKEEIAMFGFIPNEHHESTLNKCHNAEGNIKAIEKIEELSVNMIAEKNQSV